jgi:hypothetical protein
MGISGAHFKLKTGGEQKLREKMLMGNPFYGTGIRIESRIRIPRPQKSMTFVSQWLTAIFRIVPQAL